jgi:hypothetical protein
MNLRELRKLVARITYKPGTIIEVHRSNFGVTIVVFLDTFDSEKSKLKCVRAKKEQWETKAEYVERTCVSLGREFSRRTLRDLTEQQILAQIENLLLEIERHEIAEWLRVDGMPVQEPHPEIKESSCAISGQVRLDSGLWIS